MVSSREYVLQGDRPGCLIDSEVIWDKVAKMRVQNVMLPFFWRKIGKKQDCMFLV